MSEIIFDVIIRFKKGPGKGAFSRTDAGLT